ncbi:MAG: type II toxin-antitoxin system PemK/MazF family toxin [Pseudorhodoplanes sp.]
MTICERFDVAVVLFPFIDRGRAKPRPALVLSGGSFNETHGATVMAMITTAVFTRWPSDVTISDLARAGLSAPSVVSFKLFTLDNAIVARRIGHLSRSDAARARAGLRRCLGR